MIIVYVTHESAQAADKVIQHLLDKRLIACANMMPIKSAYTWEGKQTQSDEIITLLKTRDDLWDTVKEEIERVHPYKVPCIIKMKVDVNDAYAAWVDEETS